MLKAYIALRPVASAARSISAITAGTRWASGAYGGSAFSSSSLMKSSPASARSRTSGRSSAMDNPMLGLMIVPMSGRSTTPASRRVPSMPKPGPGYRAANAGGSSRSTSRTPDNSWSS